MELILFQLLNGIVIGSIYALVAMGLTLIWSIAGIPDFAQGGIYVFAAYAAYFAVTLLNLPYLLSLFVAMVFGAFLAVIFQKIIYRPLRDDPLAVLLSAIALFFLLENLAIFLWTPKAKTLSSPFDIPINFAGLTFSLHRIIILVIAILMFIIVNIFIRKTKLGKAIRAVAQDREASMLVGINTERILTITFALGGALTSLAAALVAPLYAIYPGMGDLPLLKSLVVVILGGFGSLIGALVGGLILGIVEAFGATYVSAAYQHGFAFLILIITLLLRPQGLFGKGQ